jgi:integrase
MARRQVLTDNQVEKLKPKAARYTLPDPELRGHYVRVAPTGVKSYVAVARDPHGKQIWATVETADHIGIEDARERAREAIKRIKAGLEPFEPPPPKADTFKAVAENYLARHVKAKGLRTAGEIERQLNEEVYPIWGDREFESIQRSDVARLLDAIEDNSGPRMADYVLATVRAIMNWYASRNDNYSTKIVRGMARRRPAEHARSRILSDDELRLIWPVLGTLGGFGAFTKILLLTAQRREKVAAMRWADVSDDGVWTIPAEKREKGNGGTLKLPATALATVQAQPRVEKNPYVFVGRGEGHIRGYSPGKRRLDAAVTKANRGKPVEPWVLHDLRRTARSLLARAGVDSDTAEAVLGHKKPGVEGTYNRHRYEAEKAKALEKLAALIAHILEPPANNVIQFTAS